MTVKLAPKIIITTDHAASSYGLGALVVAGEAYAPGDLAPDALRKAAGIVEKHAICADAVRAILASGRVGLAGDELAQVMRWLSQAGISVSAAAMGRRAAGKPKNFSKAERERRRKRLAEVRHKRWPKQPESPGVPEKG